MLYRVLLAIARVQRETTFTENRTDTFQGTRAPETTSGAHGEELVAGGRTSRKQRRTTSYYITIVQVLTKTHGTHATIPLTVSNEYYRRIVLTQSYHIKSHLCVAFQGEHFSFFSLHVQQVVYYYDVIPAENSNQHSVAIRCRCIIAVPRYKNGILPREIDN